MLLGVTPEKIGSRAFESRSHNLEISEFTERSRSEELQQISQSLTRS